MPHSLTKLFDEILKLREQLGSPIRHLVRPPLEKSRVVALFHDAGIQAPQVLFDLYSCSDGFDPIVEVQFIDHQTLLPVEEAIKSFLIWKPILIEYRDPILFPIVQDVFGAARGVSLSDPVDRDPPVFSLPLQCGVAQFYDSVTLMFATLAARLRAGLKDDWGEGKADELENYWAIGRELNPKSCYPKT
jgi:hypothetical protein